MTQCIVIEWADGTVTVNGPYPTVAAVRKAAPKLADMIREEWGEDKVWVVDEQNMFYRIGSADVESHHDLDDAIDVYVVTMGKPV